MLTAPSNPDESCNSSAQARLLFIARKMERKFQIRRFTSMAAVSLSSPAYTGELLVPGEIFQDMICAIYLIGLLQK